jgi:Predicted pPIWI-associating nuclease
MEGFVNQDIDNVIELFNVFNQATHGAAGRFGIHQLVSIKKRVEDGILFLAKIAD